MSDQNNSHGKPQQSASPFNPNDHLIQIKGRNGFSDYLPVQWRLVWLRSVYPNASVETEMLHLDLEREVEATLEVWSEEKQQAEKVVKRNKGLAIFKAIVRDGSGGVGTGTKSETAANFPDFIEAAETGAIGRALAALGFGTQFAPELQEEHRIVDSPVARSQTSSGNGRRSTPATIARVAEKKADYNAPDNDEANQSVTEAQISSLHRLYERLSKPEPENLRTLNYLAAKELIAQLSQEYRQSRNKAS
ncbi:MAG TPA: hypothetical protein VGD98_13730 [Ktedonobacteraceae bacterium]